MHEVVISDTSCLILLQKIGELEILSCCYSTIYTTPEVLKEFGSFLPDWILVRSAKNIDLQHSLENTIDAGEASAIALAVELKDATLILDDLKARKVAAAMNLEITGTLGVITKAKQLNCIPAIKPVLQKLRMTDFRFSERLIAIILKESGEE